MPQKLRTFNSEADVPPELKPYYSEKNGKWEPQFEGVDSISGLVAKRDELLGKVSGHAGELQEKQTEIERLTGELQNAKGSTIQRGYEAVPKADAELVRAVKEAGVTTPDAFKTLHTEHGTLTEKVTRQERRKRLDDARKAYGWSEDAVDVLELVPDLPETEDREGEVKGQKKKLPHAKVKKGEEVTFKPLHEYLGETHPAVLRSIQSQGRKESGEWITQGDGEPPTDDKKLSDKAMEGWGPKKAAA